MANCDRNPKGNLKEIQPCRQENGQTNSESTVNEGAHFSDEFKTAEVIVCPDHETKRLDRVCVKCKKIICVLCEAEEHESHQDHEVKLLGNKGCIKELKEHFENDLTTVHQKLGHFQEMLDEISQSESDTYNEFRRLEDTVVHTIREVFRRKETDFLEGLRGKQSVLMTQHEVLKASANEITSLVSRITSGRCSLSALYQTFSALNSLSSLPSGVENLIKDHDVSYSQKLEQELRDAIVECQGSLENVTFSRKRKIEVNDDAMSPERMGEPSTRKSMDTSSYPKYNSEFEGRNSFTQSQENSSLKHFEKEEAEAELSMEFPNKVPIKAADYFIMGTDGDNSIMENPDPCSTQVEGSSCYSMTCTGRSEQEPKSSEISGNIGNNANLNITDAETQSYSVEYPLMTQLKEEMTEKEVTKITAASLIQQSGDQNTENNAKSKPTNSTFLTAVQPCHVQAAAPQVESKSCTKSKRVFSCNLIFNDDDSDKNSQAFPSDHEDNPTSSTVTMSWDAGKDNTAPINRSGTKNLIRIDESSDVNSTGTFPSDHDDETSSSVAMSWAEDGDSTFKAPPLIYHNGKKSLRNVVEKVSFAGNQVSGDECSCSTTTNDDSTWGTSEELQSCDPTLPSSHTLQLNFDQFHEPESLAVGPSGIIYVDEDSHVSSRSFPRDLDDDTTSSMVTTSCTDDGDSTVMYRNPSTKVKEGSFAGNQVAVGEYSCSTTNDNSATGTSEDLQNYPTLPPNQADSPQPRFQRFFSHSPPRDPPRDQPHYVTKFITTLGSKGRKSGQFNEPEGLAVGPNGNIFVADSLNNRIQVFNSDLEFLISIGKTRPGLLNKPFDVTVCLSNASRDVSEVNRNAVIVADTYNNKLQFFWGDGKFSEKFGQKGKKAQQFEGPSCVTVNSKGHVIVTDTLNHRIQVIKPNGQEDHVVFGGKGDGFGDFCDPVGVAVDGNDNIIIADYSNNRIKMVSSTGETLRTFGEGELLEPSHLAVSPRGNVFVADSGNHRIQIYDKDGKYVASFGSMGTEPGWFQQPGGIAWLSNGHLVVSDVMNCRLQIFDCPY